MCCPWRRKRLSVMSMKSIRALPSVFYLLFCSAALSASPDSIEPPVNARDIIQDVSTEYAIRELSFSVSDDRNSYLTLQYIEAQLAGLGYERCDAGSGDWETIKKHDSEGITSETRNLRYYVTKLVGQLATIIAFQHCDENGRKCTQTFNVRQQIVPSTVPNRDDYIDQICK